MFGRLWILIVAAVYFFWMAFFLGLASMLMGGCTTVAPPPPPVVVAAHAAWDAKHAEWTPILVEALADYGSALPKGKCDYVMLVSSIAKYESSFDPNSDYTESFPDDKGNPQVSAGLLQLSIDDAGRYGCDFKSLADVHDVRKNLRCGVKILAKWVVRDGTIASGSTSADARGGARYWSVLRDGSKHHKAEILSAAGCL